LVIQCSGLSYLEWKNKNKVVKADWASYGSGKIHKKHSSVELEIYLTAISDLMQINYSMLFL